MKNRRILKIISLVVILSLLFSIFTVFTYAESTPMDSYEYFKLIQKFADAYAPGGWIGGGDTAELPLNRLIVKTDSNEPLEETYGAIATLDGYNNLHILQYETQTQTENAFANFSRSDAEYVEYDFRVSFIADTERYCYCPQNTDNYISCICSEDPEEYGVCCCETHDAPENYLSWNTATAKVVEAFEYIESNNIKCNDISVAVLDTGIYMEHEYFSKKGKSRLCLDENYTLYKEGKVYPSDEDTNFHGTHVAGILYDNTLSNVKIYSYRVIPPDDTVITYTELCGAIDAAVSNGVDVINMSIISGDYYFEEHKMQTIRDSIGNAINNNVVLVAGAGNESCDAQIYVPAQFDEVITVSATERDNTPDKSYTCFGSCVDIAAPGTDICSTVPKTMVQGNKTITFRIPYLRTNGTSMATPLVSAAAALLKSINPDITPAEVKRIIKETAYVPDNWAEENSENNYGVGIVNFLNMVKAEATEVKPTIAAKNGKIEITAPKGSDSRIYYTLDGTVPTIDNPLTYSEPFSIVGKNVAKITAVCHENGKLIGEPVVFETTRRININLHYKHIANPMPKDLAVKATWKSSNPEVAAVDSSGNIIGKSVGETNIFAYYPDGTQFIYRITVDYALWQKIIINLFFGFHWYI